MSAVDVKPSLLRWAIQRSGKSEEKLQETYPKLALWEQGEKRPTFKQLEKFAKSTRTPIGFFFLPEPPKEAIPIPDMRSKANVVVHAPSANLLDTIYLCQQRQAWYEEYAQTNRLEPLDFIGSRTPQDDLVQTAALMRETLSFDLKDRAQMGTWSEALRQFIDLIEDVGIMTMVNGVVGTNTNRKLDPNEFRGFALSHATAPLIFVNGADSKAAQMFTMAHELAHLWLGQSALTDIQINDYPSNQIEQWCNAVAAEFLVPLSEVPQFVAEDTLFAMMQDMARRFKVSSLVALRRLHDSGAVSTPQFWAAFNEEKERVAELSASKKSGGNFYPTQILRVGRVLGKALVTSTLEGRTSFTTAFRLMGVKKLKTFEELGQQLGVGY